MDCTKTLNGTIGKDSYMDYVSNKANRHLVMDGAGRIPIDHAEEIKKADYYIGSWLIAKKPVNIYSSPGGTLIGAVTMGKNIGRIASFISRNGQLWWQLEAGTSAVPGHSGNGGFVKHEIGAFEMGVALGTASGAEHEAKVDELNELKDYSPIDDLATGAAGVFSGVGATLSGLGKYLPLIIGVLAALVLVGAFAKAKSL